jgi:Transmembrane protein 43
MADQYTVTSTQSWGQRIKGALVGFVLGPVLIVGSSILLWNNEGRSVRIASGLTEWSKVVVTMPSSPIDGTYDTKLVHTSGKADTTETLRDTVFGVEENAIGLKRVVEMYQWKEKSETKSTDNYGGSQTSTTTYSYSKVWSDDKIDSSDFHDGVNHANPSSWQYDSLALQASDVRVWDVKLSTPFIGQIPVTTPVSLGSLALNFSGAIRSGDVIYITKDIANPQIGDMKISFLTAKPQDVSVIGKLSGNILDSYQTKSQSTIALLDQGIVGPTEMFQSAQDENMLITWLLRGLGLLLMFIGFSLIFQILVILAKVIPPLATLLSWGTGLIAWIGTILLGGVVIAIAWFAARPLLSIAILVIVLAVIGFFWYKKRDWVNIVQST